MDASVSSSRRRRGVRLGMLVVAVALIAASPIAASPAAAEPPVTIGVGSHPYGLAMNMIQNKIYVVNQGGQYLGSVDRGTQTQTRNPSQFIPSPSQVAVDPDGKTAYVTGQTPSGEGYVYAVDTTSLTVTYSVPVGQSPRAIAAAPLGGTVYVANRDDNSVSVIATATGTVIRTIPVGVHPSAIGMSYNGDFAYVANLTDDTVSIIDTSTQSVTATLHVGDGPAGIAASSDGQRVYTADEHDGTISVIDTGSHDVSTFAVGGNPWAITLSPQGATAYISDNPAHVVRMVDLPSKKVIEQVTVPGTPGISVIDRSGKDLYVSDIDSGSISYLRFPIVNASPHDQAVHDGQKVDFEASLLNGPGTVAWQLSADNGKTWYTVSGGAGAQLQFVATRAESGNLYRLAVQSSDYGTSYSQPGRLTITDSGGGASSTDPQAGASPGTGGGALAQATGAPTSGLAAGAVATDSSSGFNWLLVALAAAVAIAIALVITLILVLRRRAPSS